MLPKSTAKAEETATEIKQKLWHLSQKMMSSENKIANVTTPALSATTEGAAIVEKPALSDEGVAKLAKAEASKKDEK